MERWYPRSDPKTGLWYPARFDRVKVEGTRQYVDNVLEVLTFGFERLNDCHTYLVRSGLATAVQRTDDSVSYVDLSKPSADDTGEAGTEADGAPRCRHRQIKQRCAVCTAPNDPDYDGPARYDLVEITTIAGKEEWIKSRCYHIDDARHPVDNKITGELLAWWCSDCGEQFSAERWPCPPDMWVPLPEIQHGGSLVDTYADPELIGSDPSGLLSVWEAFVSVWSGLKISLKYTWPLWLVAAWFVLGSIDQRGGF